nr:hypothetical protein [Candidatus Freyarchaeota archaeon]
MNGNNKNKLSLHKGRTSLFSGKTKYILILIPAILLLTGILAISLAAGQATALPASNNCIPINANTVSTLGSSSSGGLSLNGNLTTIGSSTLNGNLTLTDASQVILGSPLIQSGALNITADKIEIGKPSNQDGTITMDGNEANPSTVDLYGNILIGDPTTANGMFMNVTEYYQKIESQGPGYVGSIGSNQTFPTNSSTALRVFEGTIYLNFTATFIMVALNSTHLTFNLFGTTVFDLSGYDGVANLTELLGLGSPLLLPMHSLWWNQSTTFEAWGGPGGWFGINSGYINMTDAHIHMVSNGSISYQFLNDSSEAGITITPGATNFTRAEMDLVTPSQNIIGLGPTIITNGSMSMIGNTTVPQQQIINGTLDYVGDMLLQNGNMTIQGTFGIGGGSFIKGPVSISGSLNIDNGMMTGTGNIMVSEGYMQIIGDTRISNGEISVQNGDVVMNSSGTYIGSATSITGDIAVSSIVTNSGFLKMSGIFTFLIPMSMSGLMVTAGVNGMGGLGTINGIMTVTGNIIMSGLTTIIGDNNIIGSMTVTPAGVWVNGLVGLMGVVQTSNTPAISYETILEINSGSLMGLPIPHISVLVDPATLLVLGVLGIGTVYVVIRTVYSGIKERRTLGARIRAVGEKLRNSGKRLIELLRSK